MKAEKIISTVMQHGIELRVHGGRLEAKNLKNLENDVLELLQNNEQEILNILCRQNPDFVIPEFEKPFIKENGELVIPTNCNPRFKYWRREKVSEWEPLTKTQSLKDTLMELGASNEVLAKYVGSK